MDEKIWRNCFLLCACRTQGRHWVHWLLQICKARSIYYSWGRSAQKRPFQYHWKIDKFTFNLYNPESFCLVTRFDNFGWNPFLIFPDLIRITLCSEKIGEAEAVKSKRKEFGLEQSVPLIYIFEALHIFSGKGIWLSRRSIVWLWKESFVKRKLCFWKFLFEPHQPQKNILISLICFHRGATTWSPVFFELDDKTERRFFYSAIFLLFCSPNFFTQTFFFTRASWFLWSFLAVQDSSISDRVGRSVCRSEPTNNQSLGSIKEWP